MGGKQPAPKTQDAGWPPGGLPHCGRQRGSHRSALDALSPRLLDASDRGRGVLGRKRDWRQEQQFHGKQWCLQQDVGAPLPFTRPDAFKI